MSPRTFVLCVCILVAACSSPTATSSTTSSTTTSTTIGPTTTTKPSTTTNVATTTTTLFPPEDFDCAPALVRSGDTRSVSADCTVAVVIDGSTGRVMDDLSGGLVFQPDSTSIWWLEAGEDGAVEVVTAAEGESLGLEDVVDIDGDAQVWYSKWQGTTDSDLSETLHAYSLETGRVDDIGQIGGGDAETYVTVSSDLISSETWSGGSYRFMLRDHQLNPVDQPWNPYSDDRFHGDCVPCPHMPSISDDGGRIAYLEGMDLGADILPVVVVADITTGEQLASLEISGFGWPYRGPSEGPEITGIDLHADLVLVNGADQGQTFPAIWSDITTEETVWEDLPAPGFGRLLRSDVQIRGFTPPS